MPGRLVSHLASTVAALAAQVLAMGQQAGGTGALEGQPRVDEGRGTTVVIHKERLREGDGKSQSQAGKTSAITGKLVPRHATPRHAPSPCGRVSSPSPGGARAAC